jgi:iron complex transport system substrate-binding protein
MKKISKRLSIQQHWASFIRATLLYALCVTANAEHLGHTNNNATPQSKVGTERIISTDSFVTELVSALGQQERLVAIDVTSRQPPGVDTLPNIGYHRNLSAEGLLSLRPTLVIGSQHIGPPNVVQALAAANIPLIRLPSALSLAQLESNINALALALAQPDKGSKLIRGLYETQQAVDSLALSLSFKNKRIAFLLNMSPDKLRLAGLGTSGQAFIELLGATNVASFENYQNVSAESLLAMQADMVLVAGQSPSTAVDSLLSAHPVLAFSVAAKSKAILSIDGSTLVAGLSLAAVEEALRVLQKISLNTSL